MSNSMKSLVSKRLNLEVLAFCMMFFGLNSFAQDKSSESIKYLKEKASEIGIKDSDLNDAVVSHVTKGSDGNFDVAYIQQTKNGISVHNRILNVVYNKAGEIVGHTGAFALNIDRNNIATAPSLNPMDAFKTAAAHLNLKSTANVNLITQNNDVERSGLLSKGEAAIEDISFKLVYQDKGKEGLMLAWEFVIYETSTLHWWQIRIDATNGKFLDKNDWVVNCTADHSITEGRGHVHGPACEEASVPTPLLANSYNVFAMPLESPSHGGRTNETTPWTAGSGSPFGWHDTNGSAGNEYTITRGNNVYASEDQNADNNPGFSPDGGVTLDFDFPINFANAPSTYQSAVITNLFYWNNICHDVL
jgi:extracellular elastinolytic metalloproteinase